MNLVEMVNASAADPASRLRAFMALQNLPLNSRLPPERSLCAELGMTRAELRKGLAVLESEGQIWRQVGRGTFIGSRPVSDTNEVEFLSSTTTPGEVMESRLLIEPGLAGLAARHATTADVREMERCIARTKATREWRVYEAWDNNLHRAIARAAHNKLMLSLFDTLNLVRRQIAWGRTRGGSLSPDHHSYAQHDELLDAIRHRDVAHAESLMRNHLASVRSKLLDQTSPPDEPGAAPR